MIVAINALSIAEVSLAVGAGRIKSTDSVNHAAGVVLLKVRGAYCKIGSEQRVWLCEKPHTGWRKEEEKSTPPPKKKTFKVDLDLPLKVGLRDPEKAVRS